MVADGMVADNPAGVWAQRILSAVLYMVASSGLNILNRYLLHSRDPALGFPSLLIAAQAPIVGLLALIGLRRCWYAVCSNSSYWPTRIDRRRLLRVSSVGFMFAGDIVLTQCALRLAPVALVEVVKCLIPVIVLVVLAGIKRTVPAVRELLVVLAICVGIALATGHNGVAYNLESGGVPLAAAATLMAATRLVVTQRLLQGDAQCPMPLLLMYISPALFFTGLVSFVLFEMKRFTAWPLALQPQHVAGTMSLVILSGLLAFALNYTELWCIRVTSALVLTFVGAIKTVLLVWATTLWAGRLMSTQATLGSVMAVCGVALMKARCVQPPRDDSDTLTELRTCITRDEAVSDGHRSGAGQQGIATPVEGLHG